ncbi:WXG100 family type VII secretion target [Streptomyces sp. NPDC017673]|uniref:WXG100 family type VII secretion target n=1 Tax=unclassified Streptomyces TaxID=2593676 RepID=UPI0037977C06
MALKTNVDIEGMVAAQGAFQTAVDETGRTRTQMETQITSLIASWSGDAATTYLGAMTEWLSEYQRVCEALQRMLETLQNNTHLYGNVHSGTQSQASAVARTMATPALPAFPI